MSTVVFVCAHGALKSRVSAALFNAAPPAGWVAQSAGVEPQEAVSVHAAPLVEGTAAQAWLEVDPPRPLAALSNVDRVIAIDCDVPGAQRWNLLHDQPGTGMRDELTRRVEQLAGEMRDGR